MQSFDICIEHTGDNGPNFSPVNCQISELDWQLRSRVLGCRLLSWYDKFKIDQSEDSVYMIIGLKCITIKDKNLHESYDYIS